LIFIFYLPEILIILSKFFYNYFFKFVIASSAHIILFNIKCLQITIAPKLRHVSGTTLELAGFHEAQRGKNPVL